MAIADHWEKTEGQTALEVTETLSTLIHETDDGIDVGKSSDGTTYAEGTCVTRQGSDGSFSILKMLSGVLTKVATFSESVIELGKNSTSAVIKFCGGILQIERKYVDANFHYAGIFSETESIQIGAGGLDGKGRRGCYISVSPGGTVSMHTGGYFFIDEPTPEGSTPIGSVRYSINNLNNVLSKAAYQGTITVSPSGTDYVQLWTAAQFAAAFPLITSGNPYIGLTNGDLNAKWLHYLMTSIDEAGAIYAHFGESISSAVRLNYLIVG